MPFRNAELLGFNKRPLHVPAQQKDSRVQNFVQARVWGFTKRLYIGFQCFKLSYTFNVFSVFKSLSEKWELACGGAFGGARR
jgi:hypothetical protein